MVYRETAADGTVRIGGQVVPTGGAQPTIASVVAYSGSTNLQSTNVEAALDELDTEKAPVGHTHDDRYFTEAEVTTLLSAKAAAAHDHDTRYYTQEAVSGMLALKANSVHEHDNRYFTKLEIEQALMVFAIVGHNHNDLYYTKTQIEQTLQAFSVVGHSHDDRYFTEAEVTSLLAGKSNTNHDHDDEYYGKVEIDNLLEVKADNLHTHPELLSRADADGDYAPIDHNHSALYFTKNEVTVALSGKADTGHHHDDRYFTEAEVTNLLAGKAAVVHNHNDLYHTKAQIETLLQSFAVAGHIHDDRYFTEAEVTTLLAGKANSSHNHDTLYYTKTQMDFQIGEKADAGHLHDDRYFTEAEVTSLIANHNHNSLYYTKAQVDTSLAAKAPSSHNHDERYFTQSQVNQKISDALSSAHLHANSSFDTVIMSTQGPSTSQVPARLVPANWNTFWVGGAAAKPPYATVEADAANSRTGAGYSVKVVIPNENHEQVLDSSAFAVTPGALLRFGVWAKGNGPGVVVTVVTGDGSAGDPDYYVAGTTTWDGPVMYPNATYRQLTNTVTIPPTHTRARVKIRTLAIGSGLDSQANPGTVWYDDTETNLTVIPPSGVVTGEIKMWPHPTAPTGYLLCNGGTFRRTDYPRLADLLADRFGTHSGDTYYLPDFRGRSPIGVGQASGDGTYTFALGQKFGSYDYAAHSHSASDSGHRHTFMGLVGPHNKPGTVYTPVAQGTQYGFAYVTEGFEPIGYANITVNSSGGGNSKNVHPVLAINYIIKAD